LAQANGFTFSYHNHSLEFIRCASGKRVIDYVCEKFEGDLMPDTYWLQHGGADVRDFISSHGERVKILHLKDMKREKEGVTFAEIGNGNINFAGVIECAKKKGIDVFIVEQDESEDALVSAKISIDNLRKLI
jgi:sugar phosphate isomerase/epimerase